MPYTCCQCVKEWGGGGGEKVETRVLLSVHSDWGKTG